MPGQRGSCQPGALLLQDKRRLLQRALQLPAQRGRRERHRCIPAASAGGPASKRGPLVAKRQALRLWRHVVQEGLLRCRLSPHTSLFLPLYSHCPNAIVSYAPMPLQCCPVLHCVQCSGTVLCTCLVPRSHHGQLCQLCQAHLSLRSMLSPVPFDSSVQCLLTACETSRSREGSAPVGGRQLAVAAVSCWWYRIDMSSSLCCSACWY